VLDGDFAASIANLPDNLVGMVPARGMLTTGWYIACRLDTDIDRLYIICNTPQEHARVTLETAHREAIALIIILDGSLLPGRRKLSPKGLFFE
jgi:hypothetical protein